MDLPSAETGNVTMISLRLLDHLLRRDGTPRNPMLELSYRPLSAGPVPGDLVFAREGYAPGARYIDVGIVVYVGVNRHSEFTAEERYFTVAWTSH